MSWICNVFLKSKLFVFLVLLGIMSTVICLAGGRFFFNPYFLNIFGLICDIIGVFLVGFYVMAGDDKIEKIIPCFDNLFKNEYDVGPFTEFKKDLYICGFIVILIGFLLQILANLLLRQ